MLQSQNDRIVQIKEKTKRLRGKMAKSDEFSLQQRRNAELEKQYILIKLECDNVLKELQDFKRFEDMFRNTIVASSEFVLNASQSINKEKMLRIDLQNSILALKV